MRNKLRQLSKVVLGFALGLFLVPVATVVASWVDPILDAGRVRLYATGVQYWDVMTNPAQDNAFRIHNTTSDNFSLAVTTDDVVDAGASFGFALPRLTSTQVSARRPRYVGELIVNTTLGTLCFSTGTASVQSYARISTGTLAPSTANCL